MKRNILARRAASAALAACMMFSLSAPALAASTDALLQQSTAAKSAVSVLDEENDMMAEPEYQMNLKYGSITVYIGDDGKQYAKQGDNEAQQSGNLYITTDGGRTTNTLTIEGGTTAAKVTLHNVNIDASGAAVSVSGDVELIISGTNTLQSGWGHAGVEKADDNGTLTISGTGTLEAYGGQGGAGIGSGSQKGCSNIVIESGTITAHGGEWGAGIGSGNVGNRPGILVFFQKGIEHFINHWNNADAIFFCIPFKPTDICFVDFHTGNTPILPQEHSDALFAASHLRLLLLNGSFSGIKNCPGGQLCSRHHDVECFLLDFFLHFTTSRAEV